MHARGNFNPPIGKCTYTFTLYSHTVESTYTIMVSAHTSDEEEGPVVDLLKTYHIYRSIMEMIKDIAFSVSLGTINNIRR